MPLSQSSFVMSPKSVTNRGRYMSRSTIAMESGTSPLQSNVFKVLAIAAPFLSSISSLVQSEAINAIYGCC